MKGLSVVDYCITPYDSLSYFSVIRTTDLINSTGDVSALTPTSIPDHSLLLWDIVCSNLSDVSDEVHSQKSTFDRFDVSNVPDAFMGDRDSLYRSIVLLIN